MGCDKFIDRNFADKIDLLKNLTGYIYKKKRLGGEFVDRYVLYRILVMYSVLSSNNYLYVRNSIAWKDS